MKKEIFTRTRCKESFNRVKHLVSTDEKLKAFIKASCDGNFQHFRTAVDVINVLAFELGDISSSVYYDMKDCLRAYARQVVSPEWITLFDDVVKNTHHEPLWAGDQFYCLFGSEEVPSYVRWNSLTTLRLLRILHTGRHDLEIFKDFAYSYSHAEFGDLSIISDSDVYKKNQIEAELWDDFAQHIWNNDFYSPFKFYTSDCGRFTPEYFFDTSDQKPVETLTSHFD